MSSSKDLHSDGKGLKSPFSRLILTSKDDVPPSERTDSSKSIVKPPADAKDFDMVAILYSVVTLPINCFNSDKEIEYVYPAFK